MPLLGRLAGLVEGEVAEVADAAHDALAARAADPEPELHPATSDPDGESCCWARRRRESSSRLVSPTGLDALQIPIERWFPAAGPRRAA